MNGQFQCSSNRYHPSLKASGSFLRTANFHEMPHFNMQPGPVVYPYGDRRFGPPVNVPESRRCTSSEQFYGIPLSNIPARQFGNSRGPIRRTRTRPDRYAGPCGGDYAPYYHHPPPNHLRVPPNHLRVPPRSKNQRRPKPKSTFTRWKTQKAYRPVVTSQCSVTSQGHQVVDKPSPDETTVKGHQDLNDVTGEISQKSDAQFSENADVQEKNGESREVESSDVDGESSENSGVPTLVNGGDEDSQRLGEKMEKGDNVNCAISQPTGNKILEVVHNIFTKTNVVNNQGNVDCENFQFKITFIDDSLPERIQENKDEADSSLRNPDLTSDEVDRQNPQNPEHQTLRKDDSENDNDGDHSEKPSDQDRVTGTTAPGNICTRSNVVDHEDSEKFGESISTNGDITSDELERPGNQMIENVAICDDRSTNVPVNENELRKDVENSCVLSLASSDAVIENSLITTMNEDFVNPAQKMSSDDPVDNEDDACSEVFDECYHGNESLDFTGGPVEEQSGLEENGVGVKVIRNNISENPDVASDVIDDDIPLLVTAGRQRSDSEMSEEFEFSPSLCCSTKESDDFNTKNDAQMDEGVSTEDGVNDEVNLTLFLDKDNTRKKNNSGELIGIPEVTEQPMETDSDYFSSKCLTRQASCTEIQFINEKIFSVSANNLYLQLQNVKNKTERNDNHLLSPEFEVMDHKLSCQTKDSSSSLCEKAIENVVSGELLNNSCIQSPNDIQIGESIKSLTEKPSISNDVCPKIVQIFQVNEPKELLPGKQSTPNEAVDLTESNQSPNDVCPKIIQVFQVKEPKESLAGKPSMPNETVGLTEGNQSPNDVCPKIVQIFQVKEPKESLAGKPSMSNDTVDLTEGNQSPNDVCPKIVQIFQVNESKESSVEKPSNQNAPIGSSEHNQSPNNICSDTLEGSELTKPKSSVPEEPSNSKTTKNISECSPLPNNICSDTVETLQPTKSKELPTKELSNPKTTQDIAECSQLPNDNCSDTIEALQITKSNDVSTIEASNSKTANDVSECSQLPNNISSDTVEVLQITKSNDVPTEEPSNPNTAIDESECSPLSNDIWQDTVETFQPTKSNDVPTKEPNNSKTAIDVSECNRLPSNICPDTVETSQSTKSEDLVTEKSKNSNGSMDLSDNNQVPSNIPSKTFKAFQYTESKTSLNDDPSNSDVPMDLSNCNELPNSILSETVKTFQSITSNTSLDKEPSNSSFSMDLQTVKTFQSTDPKTSLNEESSNSNVSVDLFHRNQLPNNILCGTVGTLQSKTSLNEKTSNSNVSLDLSDRNQLRSILSGTVGTLQSKTSLNEKTSNSNVSLDLSDCNQLQHILSGTVGTLQSKTSLNEKTSNSNVSLDLSDCNQLRHILSGTVKTFESKTSLTEEPSTSNISMDLSECSCQSDTENSLLRSPVLSSSYLNDTGSDYSGSGGSSDPFDETYVENLLEKANLLTDQENEINFEFSRSDTDNSGSESVGEQEPKSISSSEPENTSNGRSGLRITSSTRNQMESTSSVNTVPEKNSSERRKRECTRKQSNGSSETTIIEQNDQESTRKDRNNIEVTNTGNNNAETTSSERNNQQIIMKQSIGLRTTSTEPGDQGSTSSSSNVGTKKNSNEIPENTSKKTNGSETTSSGWADQENANNTSIDRMSHENTRDDPQSKWYKQKITDEQRNDSEVTSSVQGDQNGTNSGSDGSEKATGIQNDLTSTKIYSNDNGKTTKTRIYTERMIEEENRNCEMDDENMAKFPELKVKSEKPDENMKDITPIPPKSTDLTTPRLFDFNRGIWDIEKILKENTLVSLMENDNGDDCSSVTLSQDEVMDDPADDFRLHLCIDEESCSSLLSVEENRSIESSLVADDYSSSSTTTCQSDEPNERANEEKGQSLKITLVHQVDPKTGETIWMPSGLVTKEGNDDELQKVALTETVEPSPEPENVVERSSRSKCKRKMSFNEDMNNLKNPKPLTSVASGLLESYIQSQEEAYLKAGKSSPKKSRLSIDMNSGAKRKVSTGEGDSLRLGNLDIMYEMAKQAFGEDQVKRARPSPRGLYLAAKQGNALQILIMAAGCNVNSTIPQENHKTAMHAAAGAGHLPALRILDMVGGNLSALDSKLRTPLFDAVENHQVLVVQFLIERNVKLALKDRNGMTVLHIAAKKSNIDIIDMLLEARSIDVDEQDSGGWTALMWTAESKHIDAAKCLLKWGASVYKQDKERNTCLHWAAISGAADILELFLSKNAHVDDTNQFGATALHISARERKLQNIRVLQKYNANMAIKDAENKTPIQLVPSKSKCYTYLENMQTLYDFRKISMVERLVTSDVSRGQEWRPISCVNEIDDEDLPMDFVYVHKSCEGPKMSFDRIGMVGCNCTGGCLNERKCECAQLSARKRFWYDENGLISGDIFRTKDRPLVYECNIKCQCWVTCTQRVVQQGIKVPLQVYKTKEKGWAVRTQALIPQGAFVCEYVGEILTDCEANKRDDDCYLFDLDVEGNTELHCLDAKYYGNVSRFINHSCDPNILPVRVFTDHQVKSCPRIAFFASRPIKPYEEVCSDYGKRFWKVKQSEFSCVCDSSKCKYKNPMMSKKKTR